MFYGVYSYDCTYHAMYIEYSVLVMLYKIKHSIAPHYLLNLLLPENRQKTTRLLRNNEDIGPITSKFTRLVTFQNSFFPKAIALWNALPKVLLLWATMGISTSVHPARLRIGCSKQNYVRDFMLLKIKSVSVDMQKRMHHIFS